MENRWRRLIETGIAVTSELSLDALLQRLVEAAAQLTGAKYAALGVIDPSGRALERFLTTGVDAETHERIGDLPHGRGILGALINDAEPLRLHDLMTDPRSVGFPPHHPPMRTFLGVPILLRGVAYGNLYLSEKESGEDFTSEDEELVTLLAAQAAVAIENARLYESATRWLTQLESLTEIGNALAGETELQPLLQLIGERLAPLIDAELVVIAIPVEGGDLRIEAAAGPAAEELVGTMLARNTSKSGRVLERRRSERVDSTLEDVEVDQELARRVGPALGPLRADDRRRPADRSDRRAQQARARPALHRRGPAPDRDLRRARGRGSRPRRPGRPRRAAQGGRRVRSSSAAGSRASSTTRPARP